MTIADGAEGRAEGEELTVCPRSNGAGRIGIRRFGPSRLFGSPWSCGSVLAERRTGTWIRRGFL